MKIPRILLASATLVPGNGGIARVGRMSARALIDDGQPVSMLSYLDAESVEIAGERVHVSKASKIAFLARQAILLATHTHAIYDHVGLARIHARLPMSRPYGVWIHGEEVWENLQHEHERALRAASLVLVNSRYTLERFERLHGELPGSRVCWLSTEPDLEPLPANRSNAPPTVLMLGRMQSSEPGKGHAELISCWHRVVEQVPNARLLIVGKGTGVEALKERASLSPAFGNIEFVGFVPEKDMEKIWSSSNVLALPSRQEGFGLVYIEAMARAIPVVASLHDAGAEVNAHGQTGFNVNLSDQHGIVNFLSQLLRFPDIARRMGETGKIRWETNFRYEHFRSRFLLAIGDLLSL